MNTRWPSLLLFFIAATAAAAEKPASNPPVSALFRVDPDLDTLMTQAAQLVESREFRTAAELYQGLIEKGGERVIAVRTEGMAASGARQLYVPVALAAKGALLTGPPELRAEYIARYEAQAGRLVDEALRTHDVSALRKAAAQFPVTAAAQRARAWLSVLAADAGDFGAAASAWDDYFGLQPVLGGGGFDVALALTQHAIALARTGEPEHAQEVAARLAKEFPKTVRAVGGREQDVAEFTRQTLAVIADRAGAKSLERPAPTPAWTLHEADGLSEFVTIHKGHVYYRTATELVCVELASGKRIWGVMAPMQVRPDGSSSRSARESGERPALELPRFGVAVAGGAVYYIENFPSAQRLFEAGAGPVVPGRAGRTTGQKYATSSQLTARNAATGRRHWRVGCGEGSDEFVRVARWVTQPVVDGNRLLVVAVHIQSYYLVCLDAADGRLLWRSFISQRPEMGPGWPGQFDVDRPSPPRIAGNRVVCLTNGGAIGCFDSQTGEPLWSFQYLAKPAGASARNAALIGRASSVGGGAINPLLATRTTVLAAPADADELMSFSVASGQLLWTAPRQGMQFLVGATPSDGEQTNRLVVLAGPGAQAIRLTDGQPTWTATLESAIGRPVMRGHELHILQGGRAIVRLDARTGKRDAQVAVSASGFRHLASGDSSLLLIGERAVGALRSLGETVGALTRRIETEPENPRWWRERGELELQAGELQRALDDLLKARSLSPSGKPADPATTALLFRCHFAFAEAEPEKALAWLGRAEPFAMTAADRSERLFAIAGAHEAGKSPAKACDALQMILDRESDAWMERAEVSTPDGSIAVAGRVSNRALALLNIERLIAEHGPGVYARCEAAAQRRFVDARTHGDVAALEDIVERYPFSVAQEHARLLLARRYFEAREFDAVIEELEQFLRDGRRVTRRADAALGLALAAICGNRLAAARNALAVLETLPPASSASFAGTAGKAADLARQLQRELPATPAVATGQPSRVTTPRKPVPLLAGGSLDLGGDRLFYDSEERSVMRVAADCDRIVWAAAPALIRSRASSFAPQAASFGDTILVCSGSQLFGLDAATGKLLWQNSITPSVALSNATRFRQMALRAGIFIMGDGGERAAGNASVVIAANQLLVLEHSRAVTSLSPRRATPLWRAELPDPESQWIGAQMRGSGRWLAVMGSDPAGPQGRAVAVVDARQGKLFGVWRLPQNCLNYTLQDDGRIVAGP